MAVARVGTGTGLPVIDNWTVLNVVRRMLGSNRTELGTWRIDTVGAGMGPATGGIYRLSGMALKRGREVTWSLIIKVVSFEGSRPGTSEDEAHPVYWKREALAFQSDLLDDLPGVSAPRCFAIQEKEGGIVWLWLEDVRDAYPTGWTLEQYAHAAERLGRFNGAYLVDHPMPDYPWLIRSGSPKGMVEHNSWIRDVIADPLTWQHPLVRSVFPIPVRERLLRLWEHRELLLSPLDRVSQTFCHLDAWRKNMFAQPGGRLVLIDWAFPGKGPIGSDAGDLFGESFAVGEIAGVEPHEFEQAIFEGYIEGLRNAGWHVDVREVRFAFAAYCAVKHGFSMLFWLRDVDDQSRWPVWERVFERSFSEFAHLNGRLVYHLLDLADEARSLLV